MAEEKSKFDLAAEKVAEKHNADVVGYFGDIAAPNDWRLAYWSRKRRLRPNVVMMIQTLGGDPHAAYRIARTMQRVYKTVPQGLGQKEEKKGTFSVFVNSRCKSAGTLIALGANRIIMSETAELGPIDVQLRKPEEVGERTSGLTPIQALLFLEERSTTLFKRHFRSLRFSEDLAFSTKMAAETAANITNGLLSNIYQQIDPIRLAEVDRSLKVSTEYGERLGKSNLKSNALERLLGSYPSHAFVIDREEAKGLFDHVDEPDDELRELADVFDSLADHYEVANAPYCYFLSDPPKETPTVEPEPVTKSNTVSGRRTSRGNSTNRASANGST